MSPHEKSALFTFVGFLAISVVCAVLVAAGESVLNWEKHHVYLFCLALTAVVHVAKIVYDLNTRKQAEKTGVVSDERDREILARARGLALKLGAAVLLLGSMAVFIANTYCESCTEGTASILLVVLVASLVIMLALSATSLLLYRSHRGTSENSY